MLNLHNWFKSSGKIVRLFEALHVSYVYGRPLNILTCADSINDKRKKEKEEKNQGHFFYDFGVQNPKF